MFTTTTILVIGAVFFASFLRGVAGFGFALAAVPIVALVLPPLEAVTLAVLLQLIVGLRDAFKLHADAHRPSLIRLCIGALVGTPIGVFALSALSPDAARILIAVAILIGLALLLRQKTVSAQPHPNLALVAGVASGTFSGLAAIPGPPAVAYYLSAGTNSVQTRASLLIFFCAAALMATPGLIIAHGTTHLVLWLTVISLPALAVGTWLGTEVFKRLDNAQYRKVAIIVMAFSAVLAGWRGISGYL